MKYCLIVFLVLIVCSCKAQTKDSSKCESTSFSVSVLNKYGTIIRGYAYVCKWDSTGCVCSEHWCINKKGTCIEVTKEEYIEDEKHKK